MKLTIDKRRTDEIISVFEAENLDILPGTKYFRNFSGLEKRNEKTGKIVNSAGRRNFCLALNFPTEVLDELAGLGIDIVEFNSQNEEYGDEPLRFIRIQISEGGRAPSALYLMNEEKKTKKLLKGSEVNLLDGSRFSKVELSFRTWHKEDGKVSLYLNSAYFWLEMSSIEARFADYDEILGDEYASGEGELPF